MQVNPYPFKSFEWYRWTHEEAQACHDVFIQWFVQQNDISSVCEIGCGLFPYYEQRFKGYQYHGVDNDGTVIVARREGKLLSSAFWEADVLTGDFPICDLVFSRAVIDHVHDPDAFIRACLDRSRRWVYIMNYRGFFADISNHVPERGPDGTWYVDVSIPQVNRLLNPMSLVHQIRKINTGRAAGEIQQETHIVIEK